MINFSALREAFNASLIKKACAIANSKKFKGGDYDHAYAAIEKLKKGLADEPKVAACLKKANESIALAEDDLEEGVSVDMRTKGYKEAIARSIAKEGKKKLKAENAKTLQDANNALLGKNENMAAGGNDSTGPIAGHDKPLSKKKKIMKFKGFKESVELEEVFNQAQMKKAIGIARKSRGNYDKAYAEIEKIKKGLGDEDIIAHVLKKANESVDLEEGFRVVGVTTSGEKFKSGILKTQKDADNKHWKLTKATDLRGKKVYKTLEVVKESIELDEGANLQIFKDSGYTMQRNGKGSTFTIFYGKKAVAHGQSKGGKVNPATVNKNTTLTWTIPSKNNMTTPLSGVDAVKYLKKNLIESVELDEAYDRGSIRDFKVGDKVKFVDDKSSHHGQTGKITKLIGGIGARQKAHVKLDKTKKTVIDILTSTDLIKESVELEEGVSLSKKGEYEVTADGKSSVGVTLSLRHKGKQIITGTKKDGMFIMAFEKHNERNKLPKGAEIVKKGKWMHIGFKKADDVIAYAKAQGFVKDHGAFNEAVNVDMRTKGYKEARARKKTRESKKISPLQQIINAANDVLAGKAAVVEDNVTGAAVAGTGDDSSTVVKKKKKEY